MLGILIKVNITVGFGITSKVFSPREMMTLILDMTSIIINARWRKAHSTFRWHINNEYRQNQDRGGSSIGKMVAE